ncbi:4-oxalocrotonate tautomerase [Streptococcus sp. DD13]|uniref:4-oxalocrotonate tautomerase n=1 Tax=Streptococcus sp. DD13 TaxID=1777881 RepID=UPI00079BAE27|nr:4-oxalocrotonate tautomerase [Streptococcus sp. DD13]KXT78804.1 4-oxalocrotonate tautomerase / Xylose transport system permease protein XylH [Streptococcus sp. DD13]
MPFVRIELFEGRSAEQKAKIAQEVTEVIARNANAPKENIHVIITDLKEGEFFPHGELKKK